MTLIYVRISNENMAEQYFNATQAVEAEAITAPTAPSGQASGLPRRLLANGYCTRPVELDCRFQTICKGCGFYEPSVEFVDILRRQRVECSRVTPGAHRPAEGRTQAMTTMPGDARHHQTLARSCSEVE